jgi:hypothetical protein
MDAKFVSHVEALKPRLVSLLAMQPVTPESLPTKMFKKGVYLLSEGENHLYVGRSNVTSQKAVAVVSVSYDTELM